MSRSERVRRAILEAVNAIEEACEQEQLPQSGPMSQSQLRHFEETLRRMLLVVEQPENLDVEPPCGGMGRVIVDSWPIRSSLGEAILKAEQEYLDLLGKRGSSFDRQ